MITVTIENVYTTVVGLDQELYDKIYDELSFMVPGAEFSRAFVNGFYDKKAGVWKRWDGRQRLSTHVDGGVKFMTGLLSRAMRILKSTPDVSVTDNRTKLKIASATETKNIELREYQERVVNAVLATTGGGIVKNATGAGKTVVIGKLLAKMGACSVFGPKVMVYITGIDLLHQTHEVLESVLGVKVGKIGDGEVDIQRINVASIWTCSAALGEKYVAKDDEDCGRKEKWVDKNKSKVLKAIAEADVIFVDECHMAATQTVVKIKKHSNRAGFVVGLSGTPWRGAMGELDETDTMIVEAVCGEAIRDAEVTASELINSGYLVQPTVHFINIPQKDGMKSTYQSIYKEYVVENEVRNAKIVKAAEKLVEMGRKVLILVKNIKHGDLLMEELEKKFVAFFVRGEIDSEERNAIKKQFKEGKIDIIVASSVYDQGVDLPMLDALILAGSGKSSGRALQRIGRVIRPYPGKKDAIVVDMYDNAKYLTNHTKERIKTYSTEAGFKIKLPERIDDGNTKTEKKKKIKPVSPKKPGGALPW